MPENNHIPFVDFEKCSIERDNCSRESLLEVGNQLLKAFNEVGFVYLKNCGITDNYVEKLNNTTATFFKSSEGDKLRYERQGTINFGYVGIGAETFSTDSKLPGDYKEFFNVNGDSFVKPERKWPDDIAPGFKKAMLGFMDLGKVLSMRILHALAIAMELEDEHYFEKCHSDMHTDNTFTTGRTLYYPPVEAKDLQPGQVRLGEHADFTSITVLFQDSVGGLQVQNVRGEFVDATPIKGTALVNIGETLRMWSCDTLKSTRHRVVATTSDESRGKARRSLAYFVHPNNDALVNAPLVYKDKSKNREQTDKPMTSLDYITQKMHEIWYIED